MNQRVGTYANVASPVSAVTHSPPHAYGVCVFGSFLRVVQCKLMKMTPNEGANEGEGGEEYEEQLNYILMSPTVL